MTARVDPFVGLAPYGEQDAEWFFGREREVELIVANLRAARLTLLYGSSGVGKSSVLLAGALPRLRAIQDADRADARALAARGGAALAERPSLAVAIVRDWAEAPLARLAAAIHTAVVDATGDPGIEPWDGEEPLADRLREYAREVRTVLVVLDQFEEYFMYHPNEDGPGTLAGELPELLDDIDLRVNFVLGMREDALFRLDRFKGRIPDLFGNYLRLDYLERDDARGAIRKPVDHYNATVRAGRPPVELDDAVVEAVLDGVRAGRLALHGSAEPGPAEAAGTRIETPYLQLVMRRLWAAGTAGGGLEVTLQTLERIGGAAVIVSKHLGQAMDELSDDDQAVAADVFRYLVSSSRTKIAYAAEDLAGFSGRREEDVKRILRELTDSDRRVLRAVPGTSKGDPVRYELYHDVLAEAVDEWASRNQERRRLLEARRARLRRWRKRGLIGFAWVVCAGLAVTFVPRLAIDGEQDAGTPISQKLADLATMSLDSDPERSVLFAREAYARAPGEAESVLRAAVTASRVRAAYVGGDTRSCGAACAGMGPVGRPESVAVSVRLARPGGAYDPYMVYASGPVDDDRWIAIAPDGRTIAVARKGRVVLWTPRRQGRPVRALAGLNDVKKVAFIGAAGRLLLVTKKNAVLVADGGGIEGVAKRATFAAASAGGRYVATAHDGGVVRVLDLRTGQRTRLHPGRRVTSLAFNPSDSRQLAVGVLDAEGTGVKLVDRLMGDGPRVGVDGHLGAADGRFNANGRRILVTGGWRPRVVDVRTRDDIRGKTRQLDSVTDVRWLGRWVAGASGNLVKLSGASVLGGHEFAVRSMAASPDGRLIATGADDGSARVWDPYTGNQLLELRVGGAPVTAVAFAPSGRFLVTGDAKRAVRIWDVSTGRPLPDAVAWGAGFGPDGSVLGVGLDGRIASWDPSGGRRRRTLGRVSGLSYGHQFAAEAGTVAFTDYGDGERLVVRSIDGAERHELRTDDMFVLSGDGERVLLLGARARLVDPAGEARAVRFAKAGRVYSGAVSRDHRKVLLAGRRPQVFDVGDPERPVPLKVRADSGAFSPDGARVVTAGKDARVWDTATGKRIGDVLDGHVGRVSTVAFSPDGTKIVTGGVDRTIRIWDSTTHEELGVVKGFDSGLMRAELDGQGRRLLTETFFSEPKVLDCTPCLEADDLAEVARANVTRDLSRQELKEAGLTR